MIVDVAIIIHFPSPPHYRLPPPPLHHHHQCNNNNNNNDDNNNHHHHHHYYFCYHYHDGDDDMIIISSSIFTVFLLLVSACACTLNICRPLLINSNDHVHLSIPFKRNWLDKKESCRQLLCFQQCWIHHWILSLNPVSRKVRTNRWLFNFGYIEDDIFLFLVV